MSIIKDFNNAPLLFQLKKIRRNDFSKNIPLAPSDLIEFWTELGAGEIFETEIIYSPSIDKNDETVLDINEHFNKKGMSPSYTVFHTGIAISAYRSEKPRYVLLDEKMFNVIKCFESLEEWYSKTLSVEYAKRYGIG